MKVLLKLCTVAGIHWVQIVEEQLARQVCIPALEG